MSLKKKIAICAISFIFFFCCCFVSGKESASIPVVTDLDNLTTVIVDAGHGRLTNTID